MKKVLGIILSLAAIVVGLIIRFSNPDMTETRLFLNFWPVWLISIIIFLVSSWLIYSED